ncbi:hypothetical protein PGT21_003532 [Puccinia graminis f. sp. tritici]|uniref:Uncharacterized protein n=1 Tax=Puccinia graminis f. sp. tritici TaxID=56615 RepID=A0A5B0QHG1_PUCGR|nr:hypothetical protein PGT21_003532 [Puccinia graminis f. sp. tritici]
MSPLLPGQGNCGGEQFLDSPIANTWLFGQNVLGPSTFGGTTPSLEHYFTGLNKCDTQSNYSDRLHINSRCKTASIVPQTGSTARVTSRRTQPAKEIPKRDG